MSFAYLAADFKLVACCTRFRLVAFDSGSAPPAPHITFSYFKRNNDPQGTRYQRDWGTLCAWIEQSAWTATTKDELPLIKLATFANDYRSNANIETIYGIEGDYDAELMQPHEAAVRLTAANVIAFIYTSPSHTPEKPRWRVIAPISQPRNVSERYNLVGRINGILGGALAKESFTDSQSYYVGQLINGHPVECFRANGRYIDAAIDLPIIAPPKANPTMSSARKPLGTCSTAPSYSIALAALKSRSPDTSRETWLAISGAFASAVYGLPGSENAFDDWQNWNSTCPNDDGNNERTWSDFQRNGTKCGWTELRNMADLREMKYNDAGWMLFGGVQHQLPPGASAEPIYPRYPGRLLTPLNELLQQPRGRDWLIRGIIPGNAAGVMYGAPGTGKTFIAIDVAASVASGTSFNGKKASAGPVVYVAGEGHAAITDRFKAWFTDRNASNGQAAIHVSRASVSFVDQSQFVALISEIDAMPVKPKLLVIDTLFRATAGADVNDAKAMSGFWANIDAIKSRYDCTVLVVHHTGRLEQGRSFGSIVLLANADFEISVTKDERSGLIENTKQKDAEPFKAFQYELKQVHLGHYVYPDDGEIKRITSCVPEYMEASQSDRRQDQETRKNIAETLPAQPSANPQRMVGGLLCAIYDKVLEHRGIALNETVHDISIPYDLLREKFGIVSRAQKDSIRDGLRGLADTGKRGRHPWITATTGKRYTPLAICRLAPRPHVARQVIIAISVESHSQNSSLFTPLYTRINSTSIKPLILSAIALSHINLIAQWCERRGIKVIWV